MKTLGLPEELTNLDLKSKGNVKIFSGTASPGLSAEIAKELGLELGKIKIQPFSDSFLYPAKPGWAGRAGPPKLAVPIFQKKHLCGAERCRWSDLVRCSHEV